MAPFLVLGLPRSRTAWLSRFLSYGDWVCGHEELRHMRSIEDVATWFAQPCIGSAETAAAPWWRLLDRLAPGARILVVRRPVDDVVASLMRFPGLTYDLPRLHAHMRALDRKLDQIEARVPNVLSVRFCDLGREDVCAKAFEHCLPYRHDPLHWATFSPINIQIDMRAMMRYFTAHHRPLEKLGEIAKHRILTGMAVKKPIDTSGITFQTETFDTWVKDGASLFNEHLVQVGEAPGDWQCKNLPLMKRLYEAGTMQIMTARSNGRMFGYLMTLITPSMASESLLSATHTTFFAASDFPGLGMKLQRKAIAALKERGVGEVFMQDGIRGAGGRISALYRRLGAEKNGEMFRLELAGV